MDVDATFLLGIPCCSFQDMAEKDVPAVLGRILETTGQKKVYLVGHSQGAVLLLAFMSEFHEYDELVIIILMIVCIII